MKKFKISLLILLVSFITNSCKKITLPFEELIIGKWVTDNSEHYRYDSDNTGVTWNTQDNVLETEGQKFKWSLNNKILSIMHIGEMEGNDVHKSYTITTLNSNSLVYYDNGSLKSFTKVP